MPNLGRFFNAICFACSNLHLIKWHIYNPINQFNFKCMVNPNYKSRLSLILNLRFSLNLINYNHNYSLISSRFNSNNLSSGSNSSSINIISSNTKSYNINPIFIILNNNNKCDLLTIFIKELL